MNIEIQALTHVGDYNVSEHCHDGKRRLFVHTLFYGYIAWVISVCTLLEIVRIWVAELSSILDKLLNTHLLNHIFFLFFLETMEMVTLFINSF